MKAKLKNRLKNFVNSTFENVDKLADKLDNFATKLIGKKETQTPVISEPIKIVKVTDALTLKVREYEELLANPDMVDNDKVLGKIMLNNTLPNWLTSRPNIAEELMKIFKGSTVGAEKIAENKMALETIAKGKDFEATMDVLTNNVRLRTEASIFQRLDPDAEISVFYKDSGKPINEKDDSEKAKVTMIKTNLEAAVSAHNRNNATKQENVTTLKQ